MERRCFGVGSGSRSDCLHRPTRHSFHMLEVVRDYEELSRFANLRRDNRHVCQRCTCHNQVKISSPLTSNIIFDKNQNCINLPLLRCITKIKFELLD